MNLIFKKDYDLFWSDKADKYVTDMLYVQKWYYYVDIFLPAFAPAEAC